MTTDTPMMTQYKKIKAAHAGFLLFYRMGDFYELFGEDAEVASSVLGITLTARRSNKDEKGTPMCGVPHHAAEGYIATLIDSGHKVALCDQTETPEEAKARGGYKALVTREVVRLFTGGTLTEEGLLNAGAHNYLVAVKINSDVASLAWVDVSTGEVGVQTVQIGQLGGELLRLNGAEVLVTEDDSRVLENFWPLNKMTQNDALFTTSGARDDVMAAYGLESLTALALANANEELALGALLGYVRLTQVGKMPELQRPQIIRSGGHVEMDAATRRNLELATTLRGAKKGSLTHAVDNTVTAAGARMLATWLNAPLTDVAKISARHTAVNFMLDNTALRGDVRSALKQTADMARAISRLTLGRGGPRDVAAVRDTLQQLPTLISIIENGKGAGGALSSVLAKMAGLEVTAQQLNQALRGTEDDNLPLLARDGGFVAAGYCDKLEEYRTLMRDGNTLLQQLMTTETEATGLNLKLKYNKVWGRFFEVSKGQLDGLESIPAHFIHRQTTTQCQRFTTEKLMVLEQDLSAAEANALAREQEIFVELVGIISAAASPILAAADALATIDVVQSGAEIAARRGYVQPKIDASTTFNIEGGRHPVVEATVEHFIPNSTDLSNHQLWLVTGPNMAGKSTFLRQNALITVLAQAGYFVPAASAHIGLVDKIFCRLGASDDLAEGQSTFMVEMVETAHILSHATPKSLVILDEIGRGTATYDGLSIAWACVEHLVTACQARGLFATHYHELTTLADTFATVSNHHVAVKEWRGDIVFLHEVKHGAAPGSYGIHVAKLAGVPKPVLKRAQDLLANLEAAGSAGKAVQAAEMPLFASSEQKTTVSDANIANTEKETEKEPSELENKLVKLDLDALSPRDAQNLLYDLKIMAAMGENTPTS